MSQTSSPGNTLVPADRHPPTLTERERKLWEDHEWVLHDAEVQRAYAGSVVAVSDRSILSAAKTHHDALRTALARPDCPPREEIVTVAVEGQALPDTLSQEIKESR